MIAVLNHLRTLLPTFAALAVNQCTADHKQLKKTYDHKVVKVGEDKDVDSQRYLV